jgi:predicted DNA repair protein MutK
VEHVIHAIVTPVEGVNGVLGTIVKTLLDAAFGFIAGGIAAGLFFLGKRLRPRRAPAR